MGGGELIRARCEVLSARRTGAYLSVSLVAPQIAERARPGQFIEVATPEGRDAFLRRPFFVHQTSRRGGWAGTLEFVLDPEWKASEWLTEVRAHQFLDVIGPLGKPFALPKRQVPCLLVSEEHGSAPLYFLAEELGARGHRVDMVIGAPTQERVFKPIDGKRLSRTITIVTADGSAGERGRVAGSVAAAAERSGAEVVYAAGSKDTLRAVSDLCRAQRIAGQVAIEERMACGVGSCWTCVVPVIRKDGRGYENVRACVDGPTFNASRVFWDRMGQAEGAVRTPPEGFPAVTAWPG